MHIIITDHATGATERVEFGDAVARINELTGRLMGAYCVRDAHRSRARGNRESSYVAGARDSQRPRGVTIEVVR